MNHIISERYTNEALCGDRSGWLISPEYIIYNKGTNNAFRICIKCLRLMICKTKIYLKEEENNNSK